MTTHSIEPSDQPASPSDDLRQSLAVTVVKAPATPADKVLVTAIDFSEQHAFECRWMTAAAMKPAIGDEGLMAYDETGDAWLVSWDSSAGLSGDARLDSIEARLDALEV